MSLEKAVAPSWAARLFGGRPEAQLALLRAAWPLVVGADLAQRTELLAVEGRTLRVRVPDARWRKALHRMQPAILQRLRQAAGDLTPSRLGFTEGPAEHRREPIAASPEPSAPLPVPEAVVDGAQAIADPELRRRFLETAARYLGARRDRATAAPEGAGHE
jgi:hypothetical protein